MQKEFENNIEKKLSNFSIEPSPQIWEDIEKALHPQRTYRGAFWWWFSLMGFISSFIIWQTILLTQHKANYNTTTVQLQKRDKNSVTTLNENNVPTIVEKKQTTSLPKQKENKTAVKKVAQKDFPSTKSIFPFNNNENNLSVAITNNNTQATEEKLYTPTIIVDAEKIKLIDFNKELITSNLGIKNPDSSNAQSNNYIPKKVVAKRKWFWTINAGLLSVNTILPGYSSAASINYNSGATGAILPPQTTTNISNQNKGFHLDAGVLIEQTINRHWSFLTGATYSYQQNSQTAGDRVDSTLGTSNYFFNTGKNNTVINYAHTIKIPFLFNYYINAKHNKNWYFFTGINTEFLLFNNWLIADNTRQLYFYNTSFIKKFQLTTTFGVGIQFKNNIHATLAIEQGLTPLYQFNNTNYFKQYFSAQIQFPIKYSAKK